MKLSIIIPVYNAEPFLRRCLNSVKDAPEGVEVIAIDDGSTDNSRNILYEYPRLVFWGHDENLGVAKTRNEGIRSACGEYITFLDADDALAPEGIKIILKAITAHPDDDIIQLNHRRCGAEGCKIHPRYWAQNGFRKLNNLPPKWAPVWNKIYRHRLIQDNGIIFPEGQQYDEDRRFNIECLRQTHGIRCDERVALCKYFDNEASLCHTMTREKMLGAIKGLNEELQKNNEPDVAEIIRQSLIMHLNSEKFRRVFGGADMRERGQK